MRRVLWGRANSSNVMKVIWLLEELRLPYERLDVGGAFGKTDTAEYRAMNPTGLVPTLQEDEFTLWESNAILRYVCSAHAPDTPMWPADVRARGNVDRWMDCQQTQLNRPQGVVFQGLVRTPAERRDAAAIAQATRDAAGAWELVESALSRHAYVAGPQFTLADMVFGVHVHRWFNMPIEGAPEMPRLRAWYSRLLERPVYAQHIAGPPIT
jgi:glutathione S-transferase